MRTAAPAVNNLRQLTIFRHVRRVPASCILLASVVSLSGRPYADAGGIQSTIVWCIAYQPVINVARGWRAHILHVVLVEHTAGSRKLVDHRRLDLVRPEANIIKTKAGRRGGAHARRVQRERAREGEDVKGTRRKKGFVIILVENKRRGCKSNQTGISVSVETYSSLTMKRMFGLASAAAAPTLQTQNKRKLDI